MVSQKSVPDSTVLFVQIRCTERMRYKQHIHVSSNVYCLNVYFLSLLTCFRPLPQDLMSLHSACPDKTNYIQCQLPFNITLPQVHQSATWHVMLPLHHMLLSCDFLSRPFTRSKMHIIFFSHFINAKAKWTLLQTMSTLHMSLDILFVFKFHITNVAWDIGTVMHWTVLAQTFFGDKSFVANITQKWLASRQIRSLWLFWMNFNEVLLIRNSTRKCYAAEGTKPYRFVCANIFKHCGNSLCLIMRWFLQTRSLWRSKCNTLPSFVGNTIKICKKQNIHM